MNMNGISLGRVGHLDKSDLKPTSPFVVSDRVEKELRYIIKIYLVPWSMLHGLYTKYTILKQISVYFDF